MLEKLSKFWETVLTVIVISSMTVSEAVLSNLFNVLEAVFFEEKYPTFMDKGPTFLKTGLR